MFLLEPEGQGKVNYTWASFTVNTKRVNDSVYSVTEFPVVKCTIFKYIVFGDRAGRNILIGPQIYIFSKFFQSSLYVHHTPFNCPKGPVDDYKRKF